jgi:hypothetical protein
LYRGSQECLEAIYQRSNTKITPIKTYSKSPKQNKVFSKILARLDFRTHGESAQTTQQIGPPGLLSRIQTFKSSLKSQEFKNPQKKKRGEKEKGKAKSTHLRT